MRVLSMQKILSSKPDRKTIMRCVLFERKAAMEAIVYTTKGGSTMDAIKNIIIRLETKEDYRAVENLTRESFWNVYQPGCMEHYVLHCYRDDPAFVPDLDFVMELGGEMIGQIIYVRSEIECDDGRTLPIMTFGPIGVAPAYKRQGYGKQLARLFHGKS